MTSGSRLRQAPSQTRAPRSFEARSHPSEVPRRQHRHCLGEVGHHCRLCCPYSDAPLGADIEQSQLHCPDQRVEHRYGRGFEIRHPAVVACPAHAPHTEVQANGRTNEIKCAFAVPGLFQVLPLRLQVPVQPSGEDVLVSELISSAEDARHAGQAMQPERVRSPRRAPGDDVACCA
jgi:hypothetical protein